MKYLRADVTLFLAATVGGLMALAAAGDVHALADLGRGRHCMNWCTEHLGTADDTRTARAGEQANESTVAEDGRNNSHDNSDSIVSDTHDAETDYEYNDPFYGWEGDQHVYGREAIAERGAGDEASADDVNSMDDDLTDEEAFMEDEADHADDYPYDFTDGRMEEDTPAESTTAPDDEEAFMEDEADHADDYPYDSAEGRMDDEYADYGWTGQDTGAEYQPQPANAKQASEDVAVSAGGSDRIEESMYDEGWRYEYSYPESRYGSGLETEPSAERNASVNAEDTAAQREPGYGDEPQPEEYESQPEEINGGDISSYQESTWEEKYGYAEEMNGRDSDLESAETAEWADETSDADMDYVDSPSLAEPHAGYESRVEASEQGPASASAWDDGPNEADLDECDWMPSENNEPLPSEAQPAEGLERFGYLPSHLLIRPDVELLGELRRMADQSPGERQVAFRGYVESLGSEAIEFATQYESATGDEAAMLTDDVASSAAFLAIFRLYEQGDLGIDEAIDLLRQTLNHLSQEWIDGVNEITAESGFGSRQAVSLEGMNHQASVSAPRALWAALNSWATRRAGQWKTALIGVWTHQLSSLDWQSVLSSASSDVDTYHFD